MDGYEFEVYTRRIEKENQELKKYKAHQEQAYTELQSERNNLSCKIELAFKEGFNNGKKNTKKNASDAWLESEAKARRI